MTAPPERRGDWGSERQQAPGCMSVGEHRSSPVCPLCAGRLLHTKAEHDQLEAAALKSRQTDSPKVVRR
jgi:hypothetical protein